MYSDSHYFLDVLEWNWKPEIVNSTLKRELTYTNTDHKYKLKYIYKLYASLLIAKHDFDFIWLVKMSFLSSSQ